jgi:hypothetical protein
MQVRILNDFFGFSMINKIKHFNFLALIYKKMGSFL